MHHSGSVSLCRSAISVLVATALYSPIALASTVEYGETVDGVVLEKDIQLVYGTANNTKINPGGEQHIKEFGVSSNTEINGGYQYIEMNGTADYSVLNDGYQIVQMGGAANQTTLNNGVLQVYGAANDPTIKGGRLIVETEGIAIFAVIEKGGLLEIKDGGLAFAVDQKAGGAIKTTTRVMEVFGTNRLGQFDIKDGVANNMLLENGGSLRVEENDFAYNTTVDSGGLLEVMDGGTATGVDKKAGGKLIVSTNALEVSGTNSKGQFSIKDGVSKNYELDDGSGLIVMEGTQAIDTILDEHATMQSLGRDTGTRVQAHAVYDLGRSVQNGSIKYSSNAISENMVIDNGRANVWTGTMVNVTVRGNEGIIDAMALELNFYTPATLLGDVVVSDGASLRTHGAVDTSKADVSIEESFWAIIADINNINQNTRLNLANLVMSDGTVVMMAEPATRSTVTASAENFTTLTTNTLSGNGNFYMRTDMANHQSDQLNVTDQATGNFKIFVTDTGASPAAGDSLTLVTTGGGDAAFTLGNAGGVVDIGTYEYTLLDNGNHSWSLAENRAQITPSTTDVLNMAAAQPLVFDAELDTVRERLGSVKGVNYDTAMWSSAINTRNNVTTDAGAGFEQTLTGLTLGIDSRFSREESSTIRGLFFGYSHSDIGFDRGGKGNVDSYTLGAYAGWEHQNGAYVDGVVKVDRFANTIHGKMSNGATAFGDYNSNGAGAYVESGFRWGKGLWNVRPYLSFTGFTTDGQDYTLSNGMRADVGNTRILRAEAGTAVSYHMDLQNGTTLEPWLKAAVRQEYADSNQVKVNDDGKFNNDVAGTRGVYQAGIRSSFTPTLSGHLSVSYGNGAGVESPWNTQAGVVWTF
ncbi:TPA: autotransporter outer membrane beta-barrel domain-containing protein [Escherichia coli]|uniref:autotransporter YejO n=1 Tax=Escherichia coli TaxID=562 RepID=UPI0019EC3877|nr:autotransporter YejO [Escherichia coli]EGP5908571.1 autotransporter outer membrane beta-barrel domain-containing protein [Escherichia coli]EGP5919740.1 autotransporter outer membrane beta-barrel domain-containing protein [Escherichia coli]EHL1108903.1 autotransporter outer membrane beta-barrel domain-containing protein [Escherichia coli]ELO4950286.1 autotransporter outer membrane beta-barrel domain-containing protein [Escherichia coli]URV19287.1 autotransporter YejO [Escherichia coli]